MLLAIHFAWMVLKAFNAKRSIILRGISKRPFGLIVVKWDETLSTKTAEEILRESDVHWKKRRQVVDKLAATLILQDYLDHATRKS